MYEFTLHTNIHRNLQWILSLYRSITIIPCTSIRYSFLFYHQYLGFVGCFGAFGGAALFLSIQTLILIPNLGEHIPIEILISTWQKIDQVTYKTSGFQKIISRFELCLKQRCKSLLACAVKPAVVLSWRRERKLELQTKKVKIKFRSINMAKRNVAIGVSGRAKSKSVLSCG